MFLNEKKNDNMSSIITDRILFKYFGSDVIGKNTIIQNIFIN